MRIRGILAPALVACGLVLSWSDAASALSTLTGADAVSEFFHPNLTRPVLELGGEGSVENSAGVAVFSPALDAAEFSLEVDLLGSGAGCGRWSPWGFLAHRGHHSSDGSDHHHGHHGKSGFFPDLMLLVSIAEGVDYAGVSITVTNPAGDRATIPFSDLVDAETFGLPLPPGGIRGIGDGSGDVLSLDGALSAALDLMTPLKPWDGPVVLDVLIEGLSSSDQIVRFDVFALLGRKHLVIGNNPNSGAAALVPNSAPVPEPSSALLLGLAAAALAGLRRSARPF